MEELKAVRFRFGDYELDCARRTLTRSGEPLMLKPKTFDLLQELVENRGSVLSKDELLNRVWPGQFIEENNLTVQISALRKAFGEKKGEHRFIATLPGRGYKFVPEVEQITDDPDEIIIENRTFSRMVIEEHFSPAEPRVPQASKSPQVHARPKVSYITIASAALILLVAGFLGLRVLSARNGASPAEFKPVKVTTTGKVSISTVTPDGKYAIFAQTERDGESLWLRNIATGNQQPVLSSKPVRYVGLAITPDGNWVYATTFAANIADPQLWRFPVPGGPIEVINGITTGSSVTFSPDGKKIAFTESRSSMHQTQLLTANADGTNKVVLSRADDGIRTFSNFNSRPAAWSPDGDKIACAIGENASSKTGILLVNTGDGTENYVTDERWDFIDSLTWIDKDELGFIAYTSEPWLGQVWSVSRSTGKARQITRDLSSYVWLAAGGGNLLAVQKNLQSRISYGGFDVGDSRTAAREIFKESGVIDNIAFAADGTILYSSSESGKREIWRINTDGSSPVQLTANANITFGMSVSHSDGSIIFSSGEDRKQSLKTADANGKNIRFLTKGTDDIFPVFTSDGGSVVYQKGFDNKLVTIWKISLADQSTNELISTDSLFPTVSPDGTQIAYYFMDADNDGLWRVGLASVQDGTLSSKLTFPVPVTERRMRWFPDGQWIGQAVYEGDDIGLLMMPINGGESRLVRGLGKGTMNSFDWSSDGRQIVVSHTEHQQDLVLLSK